MRSDVTPAWTLIIVPPKLTSSPKRVGVKMRWLRMLGDARGRGAVGIVAVGDDGIARRGHVRRPPRRGTASDVRSPRHAALVSQRVGDRSRQARAAAQHDHAGQRRGHESVFAIALSSDPPDFSRSPRRRSVGDRPGTRIVAPASGHVTSVGWRLGYGLTLELAHSGGVVTRYAHLRSAIVHRGDSVTIGQGIAAVGASGLATAPHLHFEVLVHGNNVDPIKFLASTHVVPAAVTAPASERP